MKAAGVVLVGELMAAVLAAVVGNHGGDGSEQGESRHCSGGT